MLGMCCLIQSVNRQRSDVQRGNQNGQYLGVSGFVLQVPVRQFFQQGAVFRSEEHTSELQSLYS